MMTHSIIYVVCYVKQNGLNINSYFFLVKINKNFTGLNTRIYMMPILYLKKKKRRSRRGST